MANDPAEIGRYRIESVLGRGAMGVVYRAHDPEINRPVAIKLIRADLLDGAERADFIARFRHEAQAAGRCTHPNIVTIYDFATHEGNPFLAMEFVDGITLKQICQPGAKLAVADAISIVLQMLDALRAAHEMGVVHRDIKPANIMLVGGRQVKVTDFGISRLESSELTQQGAAIGTPSYMSPEQCRGTPVDQRSDLFSTGVVLYELLSGERPFTGRNFTEVTRSVLNDAPPDLAGRDVAISSALQTVITRALAKSPAARFATAAEMAASLRATLQAGTQAVEDDRTIVAPRIAVAAPPAPREPGSGIGSMGSFDRELLGTLERRLAHYVGPIARLLVQNAARDTDNLESLCATLAGNIERPGDRDAFRKEMLQQRPRGSSTALPAATLGDDELQLAQLELTRFLGPVARVLVKREAASAVTPADLWQRLAAHIEGDADRRAFLSRRRG
jgi:eukaryotic-like serine/threonine-protein kinase